MRRLGIALVLAALTAVSVSAQQRMPPPPPKAAEPPALSLTASTKGYYDAAKAWITKSAEQVTAPDFAFKPVGVAPDVRSFGAIIGHIADGNFLFCGIAAGTKPPAASANIENTRKTKAELQKALADSFAFCDQAWAATTDANAKTPRDMPEGMGRSTQLGTLVFNTSHDAEHYGNLVTYMRAKGLVPPSSQGGGR